MRLRLTSFHSVILPLVGSRKSILHYSLSAVQNLSHDTVLATEEGHPLLQTLRMVLRKVVALGGMGEVERFKRRERKGSRRVRARKDLIRPARTVRGRVGHIEKLAVDANEDRFGRVPAVVLRQLRTRHIAVERRADNARRRRFRFLHPQTHGKVHNQYKDRCDRNPNRLDHPTTPPNLPSFLKRKKKKKEFLSFCVLFNAAFSCQAF